MINEGLVIDNTLASPVYRNDSLFVSTSYFEDVVWMAEARMKAEIARQVWGMKYFYPIFNDYFDTTLKESMSLWDAVDKLDEIASGKSSIKEISNVPPDGDR